MAIEKLRGCGYRKVNGLYLVGEGTGAICDRLPYKLDICPTCGAGIHFSRAWTWLHWGKYAGDHSVLNGGCKCGWQNLIGAVCPICHPSNKLRPYGLLWVGEKFYSPKAFIRESMQMGVSRRLPFTGSIPRAPKNLELGKTWILFAHKHVVYTGKDDRGIEIWEPAIFHAFRPERLELLIWNKDATEQRLIELERAGITPITIPDGDADHDPSTPIGLSKDDKEQVETGMLFNDLRSRLKRNIP